MELIRKFFADKSRIAILSVCLLMLSVAMVSALTGETMAADTSGDGDVTTQATSGCYQCATDSNIMKWSSSDATDSMCSSRYTYVSTITEANCKTYTVMFNSNGGSGGPSNQYIGKGKSITLSSAKPTRSGYTFLGWSKSSTSTSATYQAGGSYSGDGNTTLYAVWGKKSVCYQCVSNSHILKWSTTGEADGICPNGYHNISSLSQENCVTYKITFDANGGSGAPSSYYQAKGQSKILSSAKPTRSGYTFLGWSVIQVATVPSYQPGDSYSSVANVTLYAVWTENKACYQCNTDTSIIKWRTDGSADSDCSNGYHNVSGVSKETDCVVYKVSFSANNGSGAPAAQYQVKGKSITLSTTKPTRSGYTFLGWNASSSATSATYQPGDTFNTNSPITLYAVWSTNKGCFQCNTNTSIIKWRTDGSADSDCSNGYHNVSGVSKETDCVVYKVSFSANNGSGAPAALYQVKGKSITLPTTKPTRSGYTFLGWNASSSATSATYQPGDTFNTNSPITLYAVWKEIGKGCFQCNTNSSIVKWGITGDADSACSSGYHNVSGVSKEADCVVYTVKYDANGGEGAPSNTQYCVKGKSITLSTTKPTRDGYTFKGWSVIQVATVPSYQPGNSYSAVSNVTLYAVWKENSSNDVPEVGGDIEDDLGGDNTNVVNIKYNTNGGTIKIANGYSTKNSLIYKDDKIFISKIDYGKTTSNNGVSDYNNLDHIYITRQGYSVPIGGEWVCLEGCTISGKTFSQSVVYKHSDFCDASNKDCTVVLGVNWKINKYTVTYNSNGGTGIMASSDYTYGVAQALSANVFTKDGYTFKNWNTKADGTGTNYMDKQSINIVEDLTLYAQWKSNDSTGEEEETVIKYYIRYDKNSGTGTMKNSEHKYGYASNLSKNTFKRTGYTFNGWNTKANGTGTIYTDGQTISNLASNNGDIVTLYAQWSEIVKEDVPTTPGSGNDNSGSQGNDNIDKSPQTGMLATILVSLIGIGSLGGVVYYRKKVKN